MTTRLLAFAATLIVGWASTAEAAIIVSEWHLFLHARNTTSDAENVSADTVVLPFSASQSATTAGGSSSSAEYDFQVSGNSASFNFDFEQYRTGTTGDSQTFAFGDVFFTVSETSNFEFDGFFNMHGDGGRVNLDVRLRDMTVSGGLAGFVYQSQQASQTTPNESFQIGELEGDSRNILVGTLPGGLVPGHQYLMQYIFDLIAPSEGDAGASATGGLSFTINPGAPPDPPGAEIPEPTTIAIWAMLAGVGLIAVQRRQQKAAR